MYRPLVTPVALVVGLALLTLALALPTAAEPLTLHLTDDEHGERVSVAQCGGWVPRYTVSTVGPKTGKAYGASSNCPTTFLYFPGHELDLGPEVQVRLIFACDAPAPSTGVASDYSFRLRLSNSAVAEANPDDPSTVTIDSGPTSCGEPFIIEASLPTGAQVFRAEDPIALHVWAAYGSSPPGSAPNMHYVVGEGGSFMFADVQEVTGERGSSLHLTAQQAGRQVIPDCGEVPVYALAPTIPNTTVALPFGLAAGEGGCGPLFAWTVNASMEMTGPLQVAFWSSCKQATMQRGFVVWVDRNDEPVTSKDGVALGGVNDVSVCNEQPRPWRFSLSPLNATKFGVGDRLTLNIVPVGANPPDQADAFIHILTGGEYDGSLSSPDLPTASVPEAPATVDSGAIGLVALVAGLSAAVVGSRRSLGVRRGTLAALQIRLLARV